jgi:hypothetical protein
VTRIVHFATVSGKLMITFSRLVILLKLLGTRLRRFSTSTWLSHRSTGSRKQQKETAGVVFFFWWQIWKEWNRCIFDHEERSFLQVVELAREAFQVGPLHHSHEGFTRRVKLIV